MRRITLFIVSTVAALVLLFSYRTSWGPSTGTSSAAAVGPGQVGVVSGDGAPAPGASAPANGSAANGSAKSGSAANGNMTVNGTVARTRWGPVQVQVIIAGGRITNVTAIQYPNGNGRDEEINSYALPQLHDQVIAAQSANIDGVSGATVTTRGYQESLQAALDAAHFG